MEVVADVPTYCVVVTVLGGIWITTVPGWLPLFAIVEVVADVPTYCVVVTVLGGIWITTVPGWLPLFCTVYVVAEPLYTVVVT